MSTTDTKPAAANAVASQPQAKPQLVVHDDGPTAYLFDTARFEHMYRIASAMARATLIPDHLCIDRAKQPLKFEQVAANCMLIVNQSVRWGLDPFAVAPETYVVGGKLGFQGKLVAAVVNSRAGLTKRLSYTFSGAGADLTVTVSGTLAGEKEPRTITLSVKQAKTDNKMWTTDPEQKLCYTGATKWARRHCPEIMLGVLTDDDLERIEAQRGQETQPAFAPVRTLDALTDRLAGPKPTNGTGAPADAMPADDSAHAPDDADQTEQPQHDPLTLALHRLGECQTLREVEAVRNECTGPDSPLGEDERRAVNDACNERAEKIRGGRGARSGQQHLMETQANATEAGF